MEDELLEELNQAYRQVRIWGISHITGPLLYAVAAEVIRATQAPFHGLAPLPEEVSLVLRLALLGIAVADFFLIRWLQDVIRQGKGSLFRRSPYGAQSYSVPVQRLLTAAVSTLFLCELPALFGFVLFLAAGRSLDFYPFLALSLILLAFNFPRYADWEAWIQQQEW